MIADFGLWIADLKNLRGAVASRGHDAGGDIRGCGWSSADTDAVRSGRGGAVGHRALPGVAKSGTNLVADRGWNKRLRALFRIVSGVFGLFRIAVGAAGEKLQAHNHQASAVVKRTMADMPGKHQIPNFKRTDKIGTFLASKPSIRPLASVGRDLSRFVRLRGLWLVMRPVGWRIPSAVRRDILVDYDAPKTSSLVRGGIFWKPVRAMSLLRCYGIFDDGCYKYAAPNGAEKADEICKNGTKSTAKICESSGFARNCPPCPAWPAFFLRRRGNDLEAFEGGFIEYRDSLFVE